MKTKKTELLKVNARFANERAVTSGINSILWILKFQISFIDRNGALGYNITVIIFTKKGDW